MTLSFLLGKSYSVFSFFRFFNSTPITMDANGKIVPKIRDTNSIVTKFEFNPCRKTKFKMKNTGIANNGACVIFDMNSAKLYLNYSFILSVVECWTKIYISILNFYYKI